MLEIAQRNFFEPFRLSIMGADSRRRMHGEMRGFGSLDMIPG